MCARWRRWWSCASRRRNFLSSPRRLSLSNWRNRPRRISRSYSTTPIATILMWYAFFLSSISGHSCVSFVVVVVSICCWGSSVFLFELYLIYVFLLLVYLLYFFFAWALCTIYLFAWALFIVQRWFDDAEKLISSLIIDLPPRRNRAMDMENEIKFALVEQ